MNLSDLFQSGKIVSLHLHRWQAKEKILASDLDIEDSADVQKALSFGCHRLADPKAFEGIMAPWRAAKRAVENNSIPFKMIPGASYVPDDRLEKLGEIINTEIKAFNTAADEFCRNYDEIKREQALRLWPALFAAAKGNDAVARRAYQRVWAAYPPVEEVRRRFRIERRLYTLQEVDKGKLGELFDQEGEVRSVIRGMVEGLRGEVQEKLSGVLDTLGKGGKLQKRTIESAMAVIERVESLNILNDDALSEQLARMKGILRTADVEGQGEIALAGLQDVKQMLDEDIEAAVAAAEKALAGVGRRKIAAA